MNRVISILFFVGAFSLLATTPSFAAGCFTLGAGLMVAQSTILEESGDDGG